MINNQEKLLKNYVEAIIKNKNMSIEEKYKQIHDINREIRNNRKNNNMVHYLHDVMDFLEKERLRKK
jgi:hypothetical protein